MDIQGVVKEILPLQTGKGKKGTWLKQSYIIETEGPYPKTVCFDLWNDKVEAFKIAINDPIIASCVVESHEYKGAWFSDIKAWKIQHIES